MKRVLLISMQGIGNTLLIIPAMSWLSEQGCQVDVIVSDVSQEVLMRNPDVSRIILWRERRSVVRNVLSVYSEIRKTGYDAVFAMYPNARRENLSLFLARGRTKRGYVERQNGFFRLFYFLLPQGSPSRVDGAHDVVSNLGLVGAPEGAERLLRPKLFIDPRMDAKAAEIFERRFSAQDGPIVAIHPGGGGVTKRWDRERFVSLCLLIERDFGARFVILGSAAEKDLVEFVANSVGTAAVPLWNENLAVSSAILKRCAMFVGNDSSLMHIAAVFNIPSIAVWAYTDHRRVAPLSENSRIVRLDYDCSPCYKFTGEYLQGCSFQLKCIKDISVEQVYAPVREFLSQPRA